MYKFARLPHASMGPDPDQPRKLFEPGAIAALSQDMKRRGQLQALIVYQDANGKWVILDGERRWRAAESAGIVEMTVAALTHRPTGAELRLIQHSIATHRASLSVMEHSDLLAVIQTDSGSGPTQLAIELSMNQSDVSKLLAYQKLVPQAKDMLRSGSLKSEKAYLISQAEPDKQLELLKEAHLSRDEIRARVKDKGQPKPKAKRVVLAFGTFSVTLQGEDMTLQDVFRRLAEAGKEVRKGIGQGLDVKTVERMLADKARVKA